MMGNYNNMMSNNWLWTLGSWLFGILILCLLVAVIVSLFLTFVRKVPETNDPLAILKERFAKGEINAEEFEDMKKKLL